MEHSTGQRDTRVDQPSATLFLEGLQNSGTVEPRNNGGLQDFYRLAAFGGSQGALWRPVLPIWVCRAISPVPLARERESRVRIGSTTRSSCSPQPSYRARYGNYSKDEASLPRNRYRVVGRHPICPYPVLGAVPSTGLSRTPPGRSPAFVRLGLEGLVWC
jgi:hypothetical protein